MGGVERSEHPPIDSVGYLTKMANVDFGPAATLLADTVDTLETKYQDLSVLLQSFRQAVRDTGLISFDDNEESDLPPYRVGVLLRLLDQVFAPDTETFFFRRPAIYQTPTFTGSVGSVYTGTITRPQDLFDPYVEGSYQFGFGQAVQRWDFDAPVYIELAYDSVPTTDPDALLEVEYRFDNGPYKNLPEPGGSHRYIRGYGTFLELHRSSGNPPLPRIRLFRSVLAGSLVVASVVTTFAVAAALAPPPDWPIDDDDDEGDEEDEEDEEEDPEPMAKRIRLSDAAIKMEFYDKEE